MGQVPILLLGITHELGHGVHDDLAGHFASRVPTKAIGHHEKPQIRIGQIAVLVVLTDTTDIGLACGADPHDQPFPVSRPQRSLS